MSTTRAASPMATATDGALLQLIWLASPALPIGGFSYSEGMESAVDAGLVTGEDSAALWLIDQLYLSLTRAELAVAAQAFHAWRARDLARVRALDAWVLHTRETSEQRQQTEQMGRSLVEWLRGVKPAALETMQEMYETQEMPEVQTGPDSAQSAPALAREAFHLTHPVAFALAASATGATVRDSLLALAFGWAENMMQAALKSVPLGQTAGQRVLGRLAAEIPAAVDAALRLGDDERQAFSPMLAILSAQHETQYSRLFRS